MARSVLEECEYHVLEGHDPTIPGVFARERFRTGIHYLVTMIAQYQGSELVRHYGFVVESGPPVGRDRPAPGTGQLAGAAIELANVVYLSGTADSGGSAGAADAGGSAGAVGEGSGGANGSSPVNCVRSRNSTTLSCSVRASQPMR